MVKIQNQINELENLVEIFIQKIVPWGTKMKNMKIKKDQCYKDINAKVSKAFLRFLKIRAGVQLSVELLPSINEAPT